MCNYKQNVLNNACALYSLTHVSSYILQDIKTQPCISLTPLLGSLLKNWERRKLLTLKKVVNFCHVVIHVINIGHSHFSKKCHVIQ